MSGKREWKKRGPPLQERQTLLGVFDVWCFCFLRFVFYSLLTSLWIWERRYAVWRGQKSLFVVVLYTLVGKSFLYTLISRTGSAFLSFDARRCTISKRASRHRHVLSWRIMVGFIVWDLYFY